MLCTRAICGDKTTQYTTSPTCSRISNSLMNLGENFPFCPKRKTSRLRLNLQKHMASDLEGQRSSSSINITLLPALSCHQIIHNASPKHVLQSLSHEFWLSVSLRWKAALKPRFVPKTIYKHCQNWEIKRGSWSNTVDRLDTGIVRLHGVWDLNL